MASKNTRHGRYERLPDLRHVHRAGRKPKVVAVPHWRFVDGDGFAKLAEPVRAPAASRPFSALDLMAAAASSVLIDRIVRRNRRTAA